MLVNVDGPEVGQRRLRRAHGRGQLLDPFGRSRRDRNTARVAPAWFPELVSLMERSSCPAGFLDRRRHGSPGATGPIDRPVGDRARTRRSTKSTPPLVFCAVPVWMMDPDELGPPSIPIQVAEAPEYCVACTAGTTQLARTPLKVVPVRSWPDQLVDSAAIYRRPHEVAAASRSVRGSCGAATARSARHGPGRPRLTRNGTAGASCAPATDAPVTRPTATSDSALSHRHIRKDLGISSALPVRYPMRTGRSYGRTPKEQGPNRALARELSGRNRRVSVSRSAAPPQRSTICPSSTATVTVAPSR